MYEPTPPVLLCFEAAVQRQLALARDLTGCQNDDHKITVEVVVTSAELDIHDVVVDFRELEAALDEQLAPFQGKLSSELGVGDMIWLTSRLANELESRVPTLTKITEISFISPRGRRTSLRP